MSGVVGAIFYNSQLICIHILIHIKMNVSTKVYAEKIKFTCKVNRKIYDLSTLLVPSLSFISNKKDARLILIRLVNHV